MPRAKNLAQVQFDAASLQHGMNSLNQAAVSGIHDCGLLIQGFAWSAARIQARRIESRSAPILDAEALESIEKFKRGEGVQEFANHEEVIASINQTQEG